MLKNTDFYTTIYFEGFKGEIKIRRTNPLPP
jgi:hypothetical protein